LDARRSSEKLPGAQETGDGGGVLAGDAERQQLHPLLEFAVVQLLHGDGPFSLAGKHVPRVLDAGDLTRPTFVGLASSRSAL
jgi:hypothetical protein